jgi:X-Pro dipeptidyl-peptidase
MKKFFAVLCALLLCLSGFSFAEQVDAAAFPESPLRVKDGMLQPILTVSDFRDPAYSNEKSDILRFCVWVETDNDTDFDGLADLVKVFVQLPRAAAEGKYKAAVLYDPTPYNAGEISGEGTKVKVPFDYEDFDHACEKRDAEENITALEAAAEADPKQWNYAVPNGGEKSYMYAEDYNPLLARGFALVLAAGIGTYGSEGFELCGSPLERDSHKCVVEWLAGDRRAFVSPKDYRTVDAAWCNGSVAMIGASYGGALCYEVAVTGVKGLKTIVPYAGIASWYSYSNSQGVCVFNSASYTDFLAGSYSGGTFLDKELEIQDRRYGSWLYQVAADEAAANGDYAPIWSGMDYTRPEDNHINCSALIVQGLQDYNVMTVHAEMMVRAFQQAGRTVKLVLHQDGHFPIYGLMVNGEIWDNLLNRWLSYHLYGVENGIVDSMPAVLAQSNLDGRFIAYDRWGSETVIAPEITPEENVPTRITSEGLGTYARETMETLGALLADNLEGFFREMKAPLRAFFTLQVPGGTTLSGSPEVHVKLASDFEDLDGLMVSALLFDVPDDGSLFDAYRLSGSLLSATVSKAEDGYDEDMPIFHLVQKDGSAHLVTAAWTDLQNPGVGSNPSDYVFQETGLEAGVYKDYTFYMMPTVYTLAEGHHLELCLLTWDPYRAFLDENESPEPAEGPKLADYNYSFDIDLDSLKVQLPVVP